MADEGLEQERIAVHSLANQFPMMSRDEYVALKADIEENGLKEAILLFEGRVLDGRNRYNACLELGIEPRFREFRGTWEEAAKLSASANLTRRHLSKSQKAMVIAWNGLAAAPSADPKAREGKDGIRAAAKRFAVNHMTIYKAFYVYARDRELAKRVLDGGISVGKAEAILRDQEAAERAAQNGAPRSCEDTLAQIGEMLSSEEDDEVRQKVLAHLDRAVSTLAKSAAGKSQTRRGRARRT